MKILQRLKNKFMSQEQKTGNRQFYVWIKSERVGDIVEVASTQDDRSWVKFTDGTQCNSQLVDEFLLPASSEDQANMIAKDFGGITTFRNPLKEAATPVRPRRDPEPDNATPVRPRRDPEHFESPEINVMREMLRKMSTKNKADMPIKINIPSKEIYALLKDQMDITKKDLNSQIIALVEDQIDNQRDTLKEQVETFITNYYNDGRTIKTKPGTENS